MVSGAPVLTTPNKFEIWPQRILATLCLSPSDGTNNFENGTFNKSVPNISLIISPKVPGSYLLISAPVGRETNLTVSLTGERVGMRPN
jgi:hypothetical protein